MSANIAGCSLQTHSIRRSFPRADVDEPNLCLRWAMYHFAGGDAFVCGLVGFAACQFALIRVRSNSLRRWLTIGARLGLVWAVAVLPPVAMPMLAAFVGIEVAWCWNQWRQRSAAVPVPATDSSRPSTDDFAVRLPQPRREALLRACLAGLALGGAAAEAIHFRPPTQLPVVATLSVVGDSITAGLNDGEDTWPRKVARQAGIQVLDASQPGATLKSALRQVELLNPLDADLLVLEIGGNDLLEGLPVDEFDRDLDRLLLASQKPGRQTVMFELPLPPLSTRYGAAQRRHARRYGVPLIPRRQFLGVLTASGATVDGIHLSKTGQGRLASLMQNLLNLPDCGSPGSGGYRHLEPMRQQSR